MKKDLIIKICLVIITLFSGYAFFVWTVIPNIQITKFHKAFKKTVATNDIKYVTENSELYEPMTYIQPWMRYLFVSLLVKGYGSEDRAISVKLMPFAVQKLEESLPYSKPYLNSLLILGKGHEIMGILSESKKIDEVEMKKATDYYEKALELVPNQQTTLISYSINLYNRGRTPEAITLLRDAIKIDDRIPDLHYYLGQYLVYQNEKNSAEALREIEFSFNQGVDIDTSLSQKTYQKMLFYFAKVKDQENIVIVLNRLVKIDERQSKLYSDILDYIKEHDAIPGLELNK